MKKWLKTIKNEKGLTLIELLAVVVILGIIAAIAVPAISNIIDNTKKDAHVSNAQLIISAGKLAVASNDPDILSTKTITLRKLVEKGYLEAVPKDPYSTSTYNDASTVSFTKGTSNIEYFINLVGADNQAVFKNSPIKEELLNKDGRTQVNK
ncbi:prepilin-type N-terminal cleavage/methylation domain-containing protein [Psychrobacillus sp. NPDC096426]|uniref:prepilin-type N-terminal cleavage/methylation domain-containing protein n=1 Tax=Psychrobacillus sp. NPDC096426 TaxID=3364491 RepID=UPI00381B51F7